MLVIRRLSAKGTLYGVWAAVAPGKSMLSASSAYVANALAYVPVFMSARDVLTKPLGYVAAVLRQALTELGRRDQIEARLALAGPRKNRPATLSKFYDVDLTAAVEKEGHHLGGQKARRPSYIQPHAFAKGFSLIEGFYQGQRCRWKIISPHLPTFSRNISKDRVR
ncbi:hypothetical protein MMC22_004089 [Lobaria immixta]|nr:hypothetical protein [Lobaria immixta]